MLVLLFLLLVWGCKNDKAQTEQPKERTTTKENQISMSYDFIVSLGSCNKQNNPQPLWEAMAEQNPNIFIWGGDNIYADTENMTKLKADYQIQLDNPDYASFLEQINYEVYGTWDDHDYGKNDAGEEWAYKEQSQQLFLDFMGADSTDVRRTRDGIYHADTFEVEGKRIKLLSLDTRFFRSTLQEDTETRKRYTPWQNGEGTLLGDAQWKWLENELSNSKADYHIIVSSIQIWSDEHGFETWGNFPHEVEKLKTILNKHQPKNILMFSGDRHISEFSSQQLENYAYPIFDFTSSGLTHAYTNFTSEPNEDRIGDVVSTESYGLLKYDFENNSVLMEMRNTDGVLQEFELEF